MKPITDIYMRYDYQAHRYILTDTYVSDILNRDLTAILSERGDASDIAKEHQLLLERVSKVVYNYCLRSTTTPNKRERDMALDPSLRRGIMEAMGEQLAYMLQNGDLSLFSNVNLDGGVIDRGLMRQAELSPVALDILVRIGVGRCGVDFRQRDIEPRYGMGEEEW